MLNKNKSQFGSDKTEFFGYIFSASGVEADPKKIQSIINVDKAENGSEVRSFLGMVTYVSRFIPNMATVAEPLRRLMKNTQPWMWGSEQQDSFDSLKESLFGATVMAYFDTSKETTIVVDASPVGLGAILTQENKIVTYASRALSEVESRYSQTEREALAILWACQHFHLYTADQSKSSRDHKAREHISTTKTANRHQESRDG